MLKKMVSSRALRPRLDVDAWKYIRTYMISIDYNNNTHLVSIGIGIVSMLGLV